jgi:hypothetical protein
MFEGTIICFLSISWEHACRELTAFQVIAYAFAAYSFAGTRLISTVA